ncbi:MAG: electron transfer flavoprotein subunit beta/FixA family protein [Thermoguttaceae bacterium]
MKIAVVVRQVPDLVEPLEVAPSGDALDWEQARFIVNESDDHALEQAILLKESVGGSVVVTALDFGEVDNTLYAAAAKGADQIIKVPLKQDAPPPVKAMVAMFAEVLKGLQPDLVLVGCQAHTELEGSLAPELAHALQLPYVGVVRGVQPGGDALQVHVFKEFPGAVMAQMSVRLPALVGILAASQAPRYVAVSRIRAVMKSTRFEERVVAAAAEPGVRVRRLYLPPTAGRAEMLAGSQEAVAQRIAEILAEKGILK